MSKPILWIVIPCYNEEQVLPITAPMFLEKISGLAAQAAAIHSAGQKSPTRPCVLSAVMHTMPCL